MGKSLIIVESPAKAKTIKKYLGRDFDVQASYGHLVDLPSSKLGVEIEDSFKPNYIVIKGKGKYLKQLEKSASKAEKVYLAPDPDREGEAIAWHITERLNLWDKAYRVLFYEITENAVKDSIKQPTKLSKDRFEAQQARRIIDRIVGFKVSPILWKKVRRGLSAGRVQSVSLRIVVQREREIEAFNPVEYWTVEAILKKKNEDEDKSFSASLHQFDNKKAKIDNEEQAKKVLESISGAEYKVVSVQKKERKRKSLPPFITSTLQQEASRKLRFGVRKTMTVAQKLYEGIELGEEGPVGLITYMRTDSVRISDNALRDVREYINTKFGKNYIPDKPNVFKVKKSAQDAHEAIRPTFINKEPKLIKDYLTDDQYKLYTLIWKRFVASQMTSAVYDQTSVDIEVGKAIFRATGSIIKFPGFTTLYIEANEENENNKENDPAELKQLPPLKENDILDLLKIDPKQHFTQPPPRFSESSLVKELEEKGIGRPSTYATIISTIQDRGYIIKEKNRLKPTLLGCSVNDLLIEGFPEIMDVQFTAEMENKLDKVEEGGINWVELLDGFYGGFSKRLDEAEETLGSIKSVPTDGIECDECGAPMVVKWGRRGEFLACSKFPECKNAKSFSYNEDGKIEIKEKAEPEIREDVVCDKCGKPMAVRQGRYGKFLGCSGYPNCRNIIRIDKNGEIIPPKKEERKVNAE